MLCLSHAIDRCEWGRNPRIKGLSRAVDRDVYVTVSSLSPILTSRRAQDAKLLVPGYKNLVGPQFPQHTRTHTRNLQPTAPLHATATAPTHYNHASHTPRPPSTTAMPYTAMMIIFFVLTLVAAFFFLYVLPHLNLLHY